MGNKKSEADDTAGLSRRGFIAGTTAAGFGIAAAGDARAQSTATTARAAPPSEAALALERGAPDGYTRAEQERYFVDRPGSDVMVDALKSLEIEYVAANPGSSFRGLHESIVNYGGNVRPELLTCLHEEQAVAMGHGYFKVTGKPIAVACHGTVGIQHAAMAVYNAWCDRAPVVLIGGNHLDATERRPGVEWAHSAQDCTRPIRDYIKWDDTPTSLTHFAESLVRAYKVALTPPMGPVAVVADGHLQEQDTGGERPAIPRLSATQFPRGDDNAVRQAATLLAAAESPVIVADRYAHDQTGVDLLIELAATLQAPVVDLRSRMNFPNTHHLNQSRSQIAQADVILGLELNDPWGLLNTLPDRAQREAQRIARPDAKLITLGTGELFYKANYQNFQRYYAADLSIAGDAQATLPALIEAVRAELPSSARAKLAERESRFRAAHAARRASALDAARYAWDASPVSTARLAMEVWNVIRDRDWALVSESFFPWPFDLWTIDRHYRHIGGSGGAGLGYGAPAAVGAALAHRATGRLAVNFQQDGDLMYVPGVLWTAAHHKIPLLTIMHNNRGYHMEVMHLQRMAARRRRGIAGSAKVGNVFEEPFIDFATLARSMGVWSAGPIADAAALGPALAQAIAVVEQGAPALIDVVAQPR